MPIIGRAGRFHTAGYTEHLRSAELSTGSYAIPTGGTDTQGPHTEDEIYVVTAGRATFVDAAGAVPVEAGDTIFVAAGQQHRFVDIVEDLVVVVVFAPPEYSRATSPKPTEQPLGGNGDRGPDRGEDPFR